MLGKNKNLIFPQPNVWNHIVVYVRFLVTIICRIRWLVILVKILFWAQVYLKMLFLMINCLKYLFIFLSDLYLSSVSLWLDDIFDQIRDQVPHVLHDLWRKEIKEQFSEGEKTLVITAYIV